ncbi:MAG: GNAT family N-acetyltransferase [Candidatus Delongbacteria bacterium]|nr:GNAT family N-acetyltransferase [Candidatus Delongbacteria bacterium]
MYKTIIVNKYSDLSEKQWKKFYDLRLLLDERLNAQIPFKSFSKLKDIMPNVFRENLRFIIVTQGQNFIATIVLVRKEKEMFFNARVDLDFNSLLYDVPLEIVDLIRISILDFKQEKEPVYLQANSFKYVELAKNLSGKLANDTLSFKLDIKDIIWENIDQWYKEGKKNNPDLTLRLYKGLPKNKKIAQELLSLWKMVDMDIPNEENYCDFVSDRSYITDSLDYAANNGGIDYFYLLFEKKSKKMIGLTYVNYYPDDEYAGQYISGILPEYRNRGLGKYLKAVMIKKLLKEHPEKLKGLSTSVSSANYPIIKITKLMGFRYQGNQISYILDI